MPAVFMGWGLWIAILSAGEANTPPSADYQLLFTGKDLAHWISDPDTLQHWSVKEGMIHAGGMGANLKSEQNFRDFELLIDWRVEAGSTGGIFIRGRPKVAIVDVEKNPEGSGGLINNKIGTNKPASKADKAVGEWNTFKIQAVGDKLTVHLNDQMVVDNVVMENAFDSSRKLPINGRIELEAKGPIQFRNIYLRRPQAPAEKDS